MAEEWARHERWDGAKRCKLESCRQPLIHPDSLRDDVCRRPGDEHDQARQDAAVSPRG